MRRLTSTIALVVVLAGLGAYIYFVDSKRPAAASRRKQKVFTVEADKIEEITVTSDGETSTLRKADGTWQMTAPVQADADQTEVSSLTTNLSTLEVNRVIDENASNLAEYGLAKPRITVAFKAQGGVAGELHLGDKTRDAERRLRREAGREARVPRAGVPGNDVREEAVRPARQARPQLRARQGRLASRSTQDGKPSIQLARTGSDWVVKAAGPGARRLQRDRGAAHASSPATS